MRHQSTTPPAGGQSTVRGITALLDRLQGVRQTGPARWLAPCPAHEDRSPSLSIRELPDGRVLLHDFGGCDTGAVLAAVGLEMAVLFSEPLEAARQGGGYAPSHSRIPATDLLEIIDHEVHVAVLIINDIKTAGGVATAEQMNRLVKAAGRIGKARDIACPARIKEPRYPHLSGDPAREFHNE